MIYIVLPAYNEENSIAPLLASLNFTLKENHLKAKILIVNDGSTDRTIRVIENCKNKFKLPLQLINHKKNKGLNEAIKTGMFTTVKKTKSNDILIIMDADNSHTPGLIIRMIRMIREGNDVVIASRFLPESRVMGVPLYRQALSWLASGVFRILFPIKGVKDYTCGYRAYRTETLKKAFTLYGNDFINQPGFSCMVDILLKLRKLPIIASEAPLILRYDLKHSTSKMKVFKTIKETLFLIAKRKTNNY